MSEKLIREIAISIVQEGLLENWKFYGLILALSMFVAVASAFIGSYIRKRAETYATKADLNELLRQVQKTTEVTEQVRTVVSHADWASREWKTLRRVKLEELLENAFAIDGWLENQKAVWIFQKENKSLQSPADKVSMLATLYFPELSNEVSALVLAQHDAAIWIVGTGQKVNEVAHDAAAKQAAWNAARTEWMPIYKAVPGATSVVQAKAAALMVEIVGAQPGGQQDAAQ
ncbi:MAG: hypothetical protein J0L65_02185 [Xanthomonadales bacterium]|nr:hypothetical protein [Xanthomonadales bacterium]